MAKEMHKKRNTEVIDDIVTILMILSGIGVLYALFSKEITIASQESSQLPAPPFASYWIYVFLLVLIAGGIYFLWKKAKKDLIPLSFQ